MIQSPVILSPLNSFTQAATENDTHQLKNSQTVATNQHGNRVSADKICNFLIAPIGVNFTGLGLGCAIGV